MTVTYSELADGLERVARLARELADAERARDEALTGFRPGSSARRAAELMLDWEGSWLPRRVIAEVSGCQPNAVSTVADRLRGRDRLIVERRTVAGQAEYRVSRA